MPAGGAFCQGRVSGPLWLIEKGKNYGFPIISYGREYSGELINGGLTAKAGLEQPIYFWTPSVAPSGMTFYTGRLFPMKTL
jgi:aldose sugar dehydrogenase